MYESNNDLMKSLGIEVIKSEKDKVALTMPVDERTHQPAGFLHGGASVLLAETAAEKSFDELIKLVVNGKLASEVYHNAKKIYPLKRVEIIKSKVLN